MRMLELLSSSGGAQRIMNGDVHTSLLVMIVLLHLAVACNAQKYNVLFVMSDEHSGRVMNLNGHKLIETPNMNDLASSGVYFKSAYCQGPICVPARAAIATGRLPSKLGVFGNSADKADQLQGTPISMARTLTNAGYTTEWLGKEHWGTSNAGLGFGDLNNQVRKTVRDESRPFKKFSKEIGRLPQNAQNFSAALLPEEDDVITTSAIQWLQKYNESQPFFLGVSLKMPHFPFIVQNKYYNLYNGKVELPVVTQQMLDDLPTNSKNVRARHKLDEMTDEQTLKAIAIYYGMITFIDHQLGRIVSALDNQGLRNNTIIVYTSDHGDHRGEHGLWYKSTFYEDSALVPLIISYPGGPSKRVVSSPVQTMDIFPSILDILGLEIPEQVDGKSLIPILNKTESGWKRHAISEYYPGTAARMVRRSKWKYCWYEDGRNQLFNIRKDAAEANNLINDTKYAKVVNFLHRLAMKDYIEKPQ